jgi:hypothetical protein
MYVLCAGARLFVYVRERNREERERERERENVSVSECVTNLLKSSSCLKSSFSSKIFCRAGGYAMKKKAKRGTKEVQWNEV